MHRILPYILLFAVVTLLQIFLFDNLELSVYLAPLVYLAFVLLLPIELSGFASLLLALGVGVVMDATMGAAGINTIATLPVAMVRRPLLTLLCGRENVRDGGVPSEERLGRGTFLRYTVALVALHHLLFFLFESLSWVQLGHALLRTLLSGIVTVLFVWLIARIFTAKMLRI